MEGNVKQFHGDMGVRKPFIRRPKSVTVLAFFVFFITIFNLVRIIQVIKQWSFLSEVLSYPPVYPLLSGVFWGFSGIALFWSIWQGWQKTPIITMIGVFLYSIYYWIDHFAISATPFDSNWLFILIINGLILIIILWILTRKNTQAFFGEAYVSGTQD
jgi:hypothetical protein